MDFDKEWGDMKSMVDEAPKKYAKSIKFLKNHTFKFDGNYKFFYTTESVSGEYKLIPKSFKALISVGEPKPFLVCDVVFDSIKFDNEKFANAINELIRKKTISAMTGVNEKDPKFYENLSYDLFSKQIKEDFDQFKQFINMGDFSLIINNITVEKEFESNEQN
jgi:hypothetical protein